MKYPLTILFTLFLIFPSFSQKSQSKKNSQNIQFLKERPKLVVGIVIDQMRYDYLTRFYHRYGEGGFKRLLKGGYNCKNNHFNYVPTKTAPGHASIFSGSTPKYHGVIGNDWYDKSLKRHVYCVDDDSVQSVGTTQAEGKKSPHQMLVTTFCDENRLFTQMKGKTIGISLKDRGSILCAGYTANASYWLNFENDGDGNWITSSFYMNELPKWVQDFNASDITESYFKTWDTYYDVSTYVESGDDLNTFEELYSGKETPDFPYDLKALKDKNGNFNLIASSPYGNNLTTDFTIAAIVGEQLGKDEFTDVLTVSYSSTDKVGHRFGPNSKEVEDTYIRMDLELERLLKALDEKVGKDNYTIFLTSDHAAPDVLNYMKSVKIPSGLFNETQMRLDLNDYLEGKYAVSNLIVSRINNQLFLDYQLIEEHQMDLQQLKKDIAKKLLQQVLIDKVYITSELNQFEYTSGYLEEMLDNGHHQKRSGDILFVYKPFVLKDVPWNHTGTDHGTHLNYDTHVPLIFYGKGIKQGETFQRTEITDIAPTMSALLNISFPNASIGTPLEFVFD